MLPVYSMQDAFTFVRLMKWAFLRYQKPYEEGVFMCAHVLYYLAKELYGASITPELDKSSALLADWWYRMCDAEPGPGKDPILLRFQVDNTMISALRPNGIVHVEIVIERPDAAPEDQGISLGVGVGVLNNKFGLHKFGSGLIGDGWFDPDSRYDIKYAYLDPERLLGMTRAQQLLI